MEGATTMTLRSVVSRVQQATERSARSPDQVRVVAVSKTKFVSLIRQAYDVGHRSFGENYVQEVVETAPQLPADIEWHFIGNLQSNKVKALLDSYSGIRNDDGPRLQNLDDILFHVFLLRTLNEVGPWKGP